MIIQAIALLDTLDKDINTFVMRVREWYSWHFPELVKIVPDNYQVLRGLRRLRLRFFVLLLHLPLRRTHVLMQRCCLVWLL